MTVSRIPCLVLAPLALLTLAPDAGKAQELARPPSWCLRWSDSCTNCERRRDSGEVTCSERPFRPSATRPACIADKIRCAMADIALLKAACETSKTIREPCNVCTSPLPGRPQMCTLKLCAVKEIVCVKPRI